MVNLKLQLDGEENVQIDLYDLNGRLLRNLVAGEPMKPEQPLDLTGQPPGIYFLRITAGNKMKTERVVIAGK